MTRPIALLLPILLCLAACSQVDPYTRPGNWRPNGANDANLRAMVAVPSDLVVAAPEAPVDGPAATAAVHRLATDHVRPLPDSGIAQITPVSGGASAQPAAAPPAAGGN